MKRNFVVAITGASGAVYAVRLLDVLVAAGCDVQLAISPAGQAVLRQELGIEVDLDGVSARQPAADAQGTGRARAVSRNCAS